MITQKVQTVYFAGTDNLELSTLPNIGNVDKIYTIDSNGNYLGWLSDLVNYDYLQAFDHFYMGVYYIIYTKDGVDLPYDLFGFNNEPVYQTEFMAVSGQKQDIYRFDITNNLANSAYVFNGVGLDTDEENPSIHLQRGNTYLFDVDAYNHPFWITNSADPNVQAQTVAYMDGVTNNGSFDGRIKFDVPHDAPGTLYYRCSNDVAMSGTIYTDNGVSEINASSASDLSNLILSLQIIDGGAALNLLGITITSQPSNAPLIGDTASFSCDAMVVGSFVPLTYQWQVSTDDGVSWSDIDGETNPTLNLSGLTVNNLVNKYRVIVGAVGEDSVTSNTVMVVHSLVVSTQPQSTTSDIGRNASFTVLATEDFYNTTPDYQWQLSQDSGVTWSDIPNETSPTLILGGLRLSDESNMYRAVITAALPIGNITVNSVAATLSILQPNLEISTQPAGTTSDTNAGASFSVVASESVYGTAPDYQWQLSQNSGATWSDIASETSATFALTGLTTSDEGNSYRVVVTAVTPVGTVTVNSDDATLSILQPNLEISNQPTDTEADGNATAIFSVVASESVYSTTLDYQWQLSQNSGATWSDIASETSATLALTGLTTSDEGNSYRVVITAVTLVGTVTVNSDAATLSIPPSNLYFQINPTDSTPDSSGNVTFSALAIEDVYNSPPTYQWQKSTNSGQNWSDIQNENSDTLTLSVSSSDNLNQYRVIATVTLVETVSLPSSHAILEVPAGGIIFDTQPASTTSDINGTASFNVLAHEQTYGEPVNYEWQESSDGVSWTTLSETSTTLNLTNLTLAKNNYQYRVVATSDTVVIGEVTRNSNVAILSILQPNLEISTQPTDTEADGNATAIFSVVASESVYSTTLDYQWQLSQNSGETWSDIASETSATLALTGLTTSDDGNSYRVVITAVTLVGTVTVNSDDATLSILQPNLVISTQPADTESDLNADASFIGLAEETVYGLIPDYKWQIADTSGDFVQIGSDIDGEAAGDWSGWSVSLSSDGNTVAIGAYQNDGNGNTSGHVRVYVWIGSNWIQKGQDIDGEAAGDYSGWSVSLSSDGNTVAIGAYANNGNGTASGRVRVYNYNGSNWIQLGSDIYGEAANDRSGHSVSLSSDGNTVAIGAYFNDGNGTDSGHVRVYNYNGSNWIQKGQDIDGEAAGDLSGDTVSLSGDGNTVAIGAYGNSGNGTNSGHVRVYEWDSVNSVWDQLGLDIDGEAVGDFSSWSVSLSDDGNTVAIGAYQNDGNGISSGHARVYNYNGSNWVQKGQDIDGEAAGDYSGWSVSLSDDGNVIAIGAPYNDGNGTSSGHVRVYHYNGSSWIQRGSDIDGEASGDFSGDSVSLSGDGNTVAIGAYGNDGSTTSSGHVRVYNLDQNRGEVIGWNDLSGETLSTLSLSNLQFANHFERYRFVATVTIFGETLISESFAATLSILQPNLVISTQPQSASSSQGDASFSVLATEDVYSVTPTYQWQISQDAGVTWSDITNETSTALSLTGLTTSENNNMYRAEITANTPAGNAIFYSNPAALTVDFTYNQGATYSTGAGHFGQLGHGDSSSLSLLEPISSSSQFVDYGQIYSAGSDTQGQLGDG